MYSPHKDSVVELADIPQPETGAPSPVVYASEDIVAVAYHLTSGDGATALVSFIAPYVHMFGAPNDEALHGHPLYDRGLSFYRAYEVRDSSWVAALEQMNRVHMFHAPAMFAPLRHFIITFHDTTFECIARSYSASMQTVSPPDALRLLHTPSI